MNYAFQLKGLSKNGTSGGVYDYSHAELPELNQKNLYEQKGLKGDTNGSGSEGYGTIHYCSLDLIISHFNTYESVYPANGPIDWNCSKNIDQNPVSSDIIGPDGGCPNNESACAILGGFDDWSYVIKHLKQGAIGQAGVLPVLAAFSPVEQLTPETVAKALGGYRINLPLVKR
jgi:hypothetical protein